METYQEEKPPVKSRKVAQGEITKKRILRVAREQFSSQGFAATSTESIVRAADVTRGALYHHFRDKEDLFRAVIEAVEREIGDRVLQAAASGGGDPRKVAGAVWDAVLDTALDPDLTRLRLLEAPAVLPWEVWHGIQARFALGNIEALINAMKGAGVLDASAPRALAVLLMGATSEAVAFIANADDIEQARFEVGEAAQWLNGRILT